jgi:nucleosome assembly protein 1-like 1
VAEPIAQSPAPEATAASSAPAEEQKAERDLIVQEKAAAKEIEKLTGPTKDCAIAILGLQKQRDQLFHEYLAEIRALELRYHDKYQPLYEQRKEVLTSHAQLEGFWLKTMHGNMMVKGYIFEKDEELLRYLVDIRCIEQPTNDDFSLEFVFAENPYISDTVLTKKFIHDVDTDLIKAEGCEIHWKGENFTEKKIKKKKSKKGKTQTIVKTVPNPSFFTFFVTKTEGDHESEEDEGDEEGDFHMSMLEDDEDLGVEIRDEVIPNALLFYLGVRQSEDDLEGMEIEEEDSDEEGEEHKPQRKKSKGDKEKKTVDAAGKGKDECKNQ